MFKPISESTRWPLVPVELHLEAADLLHVAQMERMSALLLFTLKTSLVVRDLMALLPSQLLHLEQSDKLLKTLILALEKK